MQALYFAYGSNMSQRRLGARVASASVVDTASLEAYRLHFRKAGRDGSSKCDIEALDSNHDCVIGVLFRLLLPDLTILDRFEGCGNGYERKQLTVTTSRGDCVQAHTYIATHIDDALAPYHWYKQHVLTGAREQSLPAHYIDRIERVRSIDDPDRRRHDHELAIYRQQL